MQNELGAITTLVLTCAEIRQNSDQVIHFPQSASPHAVTCAAVSAYSVRSAAMPPWIRRSMPWAGAPTGSCLTLLNASTQKPNNGQASVLWKREGKNNPLTALVVVVWAGQKKRTYYWSAGMQEVWSQYLFSCLYHLIFTFYFIWRYFCRMVYSLCSTFTLSL